MDSVHPANIVEVVGNANFDGLQTAMQPFIYLYDPKDLGPVSVRIKPVQTQAALSAMDRIWHHFMPTLAIRRRFQEDSFDRPFTADEREGRIFSIFVGVAISSPAWACSAPSSFTAERRTKEIGVRKVFGTQTRYNRAASVMAVLHFRPDSEPHRLAGGLVFPAPLAARLCLQDRVEPVLFPGSRNHRAGHRLGDGHHPHAGRFLRQSGSGFAVAPLLRAGTVC